ncbi:MAG: hypothetical protein ACREFH_14465 [Stellaceae bacterium]
MPAPLPVPPLPEELASGAEHDAVFPPLLPAQVQVHGLLPLTVEALPAVQRLDVGALLTATLLAEPQTPLTAVAATEARHCAVAPPLLPAQLQRHGPLPETADAVPAAHRFVAGALFRAAPFEEPHTPLTEPPPLAVRTA